MLDWLKIVPEDAAYRWQKNPFMGRFPPFDWDLFSEKMGAQPGFADFRVDATNLQYSDNPLRELPEQCTTAQIALSGLQGTIFCLLPVDQSNQLFNELIGEESLADQSLKEAFLRYFISQALEIAGSIPPIQQFATTLVAFEERPQSAHLDSSHLFADINIKHLEQAFAMRLIFDDLFVQSWRDYWAGKNVPTSQDLASSPIELPIQCLAGQTMLTIDEIKDLAVGDWIKLDSHGFDAALKPTQLTLALGDRPLGHGLVEAEGLKIREFTPILTSNTSTPS